MNNSHGRHAAPSYRKAALRSALLGFVVALTGLAGSAQADLFVTNVFYGWDEPQAKFQNSNVTIATNGAWTQFYHQFGFDADAYVFPSTEPAAGTFARAVWDAYPSCRGTTSIWAGQMELGLYHTDNAPLGAPGFQASRDWEVVACDRDADGTGIEGGNGDLAFPNPATRYTISTTSDPDAHILLLAQDVVTACSTGNCLNEIVTTLFVNLDTNCDGDIDPDVRNTDLHGAIGVNLPYPQDTNPNDNSGTGICFFAEGRKPFPASPSWSGNIQARITAGGGDKTVNFNPQVTAALVSDVSAVQRGANGYVEWDTVSEVATAGFHLEREDSSGAFVRVNDKLIPALPYAPHGGSYSYRDDGIAAGGTYNYRLVEVENSGNEIVHGPYSVTVAAGSGKGHDKNSNAKFSQQAKGPSLGEQKRSEKAKAARKAQGAAAAAATAPAARIEVSKTGLYFLDRAVIAQVFGVSDKDARNLLQSGQLALRNRGRDVAWLAADKVAGLYFYGEAIDSPYTTENVYQLAPGAGRAMVTVTGRAPKSSTSGQVFRDAAHAEQDLMAIPIIDDPEGDFWFWDYLHTAIPSATAKTFTIGTPARAGQGTAALSLSLMGATDLALGNDHQIEVFVNGTSVGTDQWDGRSLHTFHANVDQSLLVDGDNQIRVQASTLPGVSYSVFWVDAIDVSYDRFYDAKGKSLLVSSETNGVVTVSSLAGRDVRVLDVSDDASPVAYADSALRVSGNGGSGYAVSFEPQAQNGRYLVATGGDVLSPDAVVADQPSDLRSTANGTDYLIIAPRVLSDGANALAAYRSSTGLGVKIAYLDDVFDEFNGGIVDPNAIESFLSYVHSSWSTVPKFVAIAGKGTFDHKDRLGLGTSLVPVLLASTPYGLFASDNRLMDVVGDDGVPEFAGGRISVVSSDELLAYVGKVQAYESRVDPAWANRAVLLADNPDEAGDFYADVDALADHLPAAFDAIKIKHQAGDPGTVTRDALLNLVNSPVGVGAVFYAGHGGSSGLGSEGFLKLDDVALMNNGDRLPVFATMTCGAGNSMYPGYDSLVERLLWHDNGGAVAAVAPTGLSWDDEAHELNLALADAMYGPGAVATLGEALQRTLSEIAGLGVKRALIDVYYTSGDPALRISH